MSLVFRPQVEQSVASMGLLIYWEQRAEGGQKGGREERRERRKSSPSAQGGSPVFWTVCEVAVNAAQSRKLICVLSWKWVKEWRQREPTGLKLLGDVCLFSFLHQLQRKPPEIKPRSVAADFVSQLHCTNPSLAHMN